VIGQFNLNLKSPQKTELKSVFTGFSILSLYYAERLLY